MESKLKKCFIFILESPLIALFTIARLLVCIMTVVFIRVIRKGISQGNKLHTTIEHHELGFRKKK